MRRSPGLQDAMLLGAGEAPTAGGAAVDEILIAGAMAGVVMLAVGWQVLRERQGHRTAVGRLADAVARVDGLPRWVGLPMYLAIASLLTAGFGVWWDVPIHMQNGRDEGPLANPSHYPIFLGILGFLHAGILSVGLARGPMPRHTVRLAPSWQAPMGALVIVAAGLIALVGFPADDLWHRLFGQDVTEWGPTHVMMIGGAVTCILGCPLLLAEARQVGAPGTRTTVGRHREALVLALCMIPFAFLMEFDLGVPQFPAATQFIIFGFIAAWICIAVRMHFGPGGALLAGGLYLAIHAVLYFSIAALPGVLTARFLLFLPSALLVELIALWLDPRRRRTAFAATSAVAVGSLGMAAEWAWSRVFMPLPQPFDAASLLWIVPIGVLAAIGGGLLAVWHASSLERVAAPEAPAPTSRTATGWRRQGTGLAGVGIFVALMAVFAPPSSGDTDIRATVTYDDVTYADGTTAAACQGGRERCEAHAIVQVSPASALDDAVWFYGLAWQGRGPGGHDETGPVDPESGVGGVVRVAMEPTGTPGEFRSTHPLPIYGSWKTMLRIHLFPTTMLAVPLHAPDDPAIESERGREILMTNGETLPASDEKQFLQREQREDVPTWLWSAAYAAVIGSWLLLILFYGWCHAVASRPGPTTPATRRDLEGSTA